MRERKIELMWGPQGPVVEHLTGTEAKIALREMMVAHRQESETRARVVQTVIALIYREAVRGVLGPDGEPALPMRMSLGPDVLQYAQRPLGISWEHEMGGGVTIVVQRAPNAPTPVEAPAPKIEIAKN